MTNKEKYQLFCVQTYVPIYSKSWWMDAVCGADNWDVWLYEKGNNILAALPYYMEERNGYKYITKAPLTQNNGIIFNYPESDMKNITRQQFEEEVIDEAYKFISGFGLDVYEQQYHYDFTYYLPFFWHQFSIITRVTYVIDDTQDTEKVWNGFSSKYRKNIKKGQKNAVINQDLDAKIFYEEHKKVFLKQNLPCPFSYELWMRVYDACIKNNAGKILYAKTTEGNIASLLFVVWDEKSMYHLIGGSMPEYQRLESYNALTWYAIQLASQMKLKYDFEGSVIKRISKSFREFGGEPKRYYRIRKIFNEDILRKECEEQITKLREEMQNDL